MGIKKEEERGQEVEIKKELRI